MIKGLKFASSVLVGVVAVSAGVMLAMHFGLIPGFKAYVLLSGSMMPALDPGSVVLVQQKPWGYSVGDIVTFKSKGTKIETTHRISALEAEGSELLYRTKGDANKQPDAQAVAYEDVVGSLVWTMPYLGYAVNFAKTPKGFILLVIIPATIVIYEELKTTKRELGQQLTKLKAKFWVWREKRQRNDLLTINLLPKKKPRIAYEVSVVPILGAAMIFVAVSGSWFSDLENSVGNILGAAASFGPQPGDVVINEIMWMGSQGNASDEWIELRNMTSSVIDLSNWVVDNLGSGGSNNIVIPAGKTIAANGFFLISNDPQSTSIISVDPDHQTSSVSIQNPGEQLVLRDNNGNVIDTADNDGDGWFAGDDNPEKSMERNNIPGDGTVAGNWHTATGQTNLDAGTDELATPRAANSSP